MKKTSAFLAILTLPLLILQAASACPLIGDPGGLVEALETVCSPAELVSIGQWRVPGMPEPDQERPRRRGLSLFPGPQLLSVNASLFAAPMIRFGAADDATPALAPYGDYWSTGAGIQVDLHLRVLAFADAYVGVAVVHHSSTGSRNWEKTIGVNDLKIRYKFDPLYMFPLEIGGKGYLKLKSGPWTAFLEGSRRDPMGYLRIGAGPVFHAGANFKYSRYVNDLLTEEGDKVWWPAQSTLGIHVALGFEWGGFRSEKGFQAPGLFFELGYRYVAAPVVTEFGDDSDSMHTILFSIGAHLP